MAETFLEHERTHRRCEIDGCANPALFFPVILIWGAHESRKKDEPSEIHLRAQFCRVHRVEAEGVSAQDLKNPQVDELIARHNLNVCSAEIDGDLSLSILSILLIHR